MLSQVVSQELSGFLALLNLMVLFLGVTVIVMMSSCQKVQVLQKEFMVWLELCQEQPSLDITQAPCPMLPVLKQKLAPLMMFQWQMPKDIQEVSLVILMLITLVRVEDILLPSMLGSIKAILVLQLLFWTIVVLFVRVWLECFIVSLKLQHTLAQVSADTQICRMFYILSSEEIAFSRSSCLFLRSQMVSEIERTQLELSLADLVSLNWFLQDRKNWSISQVQTPFNLALWTICWKSEALGRNTMFFSFPKQLLIDYFSIWIPSLFFSLWEVAVHFEYSQSISAASLTRAFPELNSARSS